MIDEIVNELHGANFFSSQVSLISTLWTMLHLKGDGMLSIMDLLGKPNVGPSNQVGRVDELEDT